MFLPLSLGNLLAVCTLLRRRMRVLSTYAYLTALCLSNSVTLSSVIAFELDILVAPSRCNCIVVSLAKALASSTFALSTWYAHLSLLSRKASQVALLFF